MLLFPLCIATPASRSGLPVMEELHFGPPYFLIFLQLKSILIQPTYHQNYFRRAGQDIHTERCVFLTVPDCLLLPFKLVRSHEYRKQGCGNTMSNACHSTSAPKCLLVIVVPIRQAGTRRTR